MKEEEGGGRREKEQRMRGDETEEGEGWGVREGEGVRGGGRYSVIMD